MMMSRPFLKLAPKIVVSDAFCAHALKVVQCKPCLESTLLQATPISWIFRPNYTRVLHQVREKFAVQELHLGQ